MSLVIVGIITNPLLNQLENKELKRVDPLKMLIENDDLILPTSGMQTNSSKGKIRTSLTHFAIDFIFSVGLMVYLFSIKDTITPDFFHFVMCLNEDLCHLIWIILLWLTYKTYYS